jgi:hypothetical protein
MIPYSSVGQLDWDFHHANIICLVLAKPNNFKYIFVEKVQKTKINAKNFINIEY